jgi:hypothetical protein
MLQALRPEDALAIAEVSRRRSYDEQAMAQYLGIGRGARANGAPPDGTLLRLPGDVDLAAFESEERRHFVQKGFKFFTMPWGPWATAGIQNGLSGIKR